MVSIEDGEIKGITDFLDYTNNEYAKRELEKIVNSKTLSKDAIVERQEIIKWLLHFVDKIDVLTYFKTEMRDVYELTASFDGNKNITTVSFLFQRKDYQNWEDKMKLSVILLFKIIRFLNLFYDNKIDHPFKKKISEMISFLNKFRIQRLYISIQENKITLKQVKYSYETLSDVNKSKQFLNFWNEFFYFEALISIAVSIKRNGFNFPVISDHTLVIEDFYYPLLNIEGVVKNSVNIDKNVILLTGPNMSGKSTLLKAMGACIFLANIGLAIPAKSAVIPFYKNIFIFLDHSDDMSNGLSHFTNELEKFKRAVLVSSHSDYSFAIFDELFQGTNITDAIKISQYAIRGLTKFKKSTFMISTHLYEIFDNNDSLDKNILTLYLDSTIENDTPVFNYKLKAGVSEMRIGMYLFRKFGLYELLKH